MDGRRQKLSPSFLEHYPSLQTSQFSRRKFLSAISSTAIGAVSISATSDVALSQSGSSEAWPQRHFNATNNGYAPQNTGPSIESNTESVEQWRSELERSFGTQPVIADGTVFIPAEAPSSGADSRPNSGLFAYDTTSGTEQWFFDQMGNIWGCTAGSNGLVYALGGGSVYAINNANGTVEWSTQTAGGANQNATISGSVIYVGTRGNPSTPATIQALQLDDGSEQWSYEFPIYDEEQETKISPPAVTEDTVYVGLGSLFAEAGGVFALDAAGGEEKWSVDVNSNVAAPTVGGDRVYVGTGGGNGFTLYALDSSTGSEQWTYVSGAMLSPTVVNETIYAGYYGGFAALDSGSGEVQWEIEAEADRTSSPAIVNNRMYVTDGNQLKTIERENGEIVWSFELDSIAHSDPIVANQSVFVFSVDGTLYAIGEDTADSTATPTGTPTTTAESAGNPDGSGGINPTPTDVSTTEESSSSTVSGVTQTASINQQQGTAGRNQNGSRGGGGISFWTDFGSSGSTDEITVLGTALGLTGIYAAYRRLSGDND